MKSIIKAVLAQLVEHALRKRTVVGMIRIIGRYRISFVQFIYIHQHNHGARPVQSRTHPRSEMMQCVNASLRGMECGRPESEHLSDIFFILRQYWLVPETLLENHFEKNM